MLLILLFFTALQRTRVEQPSFTLQLNSQPGAASQWFNTVATRNEAEIDKDVWGGKKSDKLYFLCKARSEAISAKKTWDTGHFEHFQHKGNSMAEQRALCNQSLLRLQHWSVPTQHHQLSNPTAFLRDELKNIKEQEPGPILPKFISSSIILQPHELHHFKRQQNSPSQSEFPRLQSQGDSAGGKKSSNWPWIDLQALVKRKQENQRRPSTK